MSVLVGSDGAVLQVVAGPAVPAGVLVPLTGRDGIQGIQGPQGPQGPIGATGADSTVPGPKGGQGDTGPRGEKGDTGERGLTGLTGASGEVTTAALTAGLEGKADLIGGKVPQSQIPAAALTDYLGEVATQAAMLGLVGERGDWCTRTDTGTDWQAIAEPTSVLSSWREHTYPQSPVQSVAGRTGAVTLSIDDVGGLNVALGGKSPNGHTHTAASIGAVTAPTGGLTIWRGTEAQYAAIGTKDPNTLYLRLP